MLLDELILYMRLIYKGWFSSSWPDILHVPAWLLRWFRSSLFSPTVFFTGSILSIYLIGAVKKPDLIAKGRSPGFQDVIT